MLCRVKGVGLGLEHRQQRELVARVYPGEHFEGQGRDLGVSTLSSTDHWSRKVRTKSEPMA